MHVDKKNMDILCYSLENKNKYAQISYKHSNTEEF